MLLFFISTQMAVNPVSAYIENAHSVPFSGMIFGFPESALSAPLQQIFCHICIRHSAISVKENPSQ